MEKKIYFLTENTIIRLNNYLISKPWNEVNELISIIQSELIPQQKTEKDSPKQEEKPPK